jgi:ATP-binding cassette subfamily B protein
VAKREFTVSGAHHYNASGPIAWIVSHILRYKRILLLFALTSILANAFYGFAAVFTGRAFNDVLHSRDPRSQLVQAAVLLLASVIGTGAFDLAARSLIQFMAGRLARDARDELYISLLGKSQTFHNRQRVGDIMARAANDVSLLSDMVVPGIDTTFDSSTALIIPTVFIGFLNWHLLLVPLVFIVAHIFALRSYMRQLAPVSTEMRASFGQLNAQLAETVSGIELVKATAQEPQERAKFNTNARVYRDLYIRNGLIQGRYLPPLLFAIALAAGLLDGLMLVSQGELTVGGLVTFIALMGTFRFPVFVSIFSFSVLQMGIAASERILELIRAETDLDENEAGFTATMRGDLVFEHVSFGYDNGLVLKDVSFRAAPGTTVAIVGQTGSGKSSLTRLVNRIYDVSAGRVTIDGVDVRDWQLDALRSQISTIEQDIFLFSRTVAENIAFGMSPDVDRSAIESAARDAQAHDFIMNFRDGYDTVLGERGVTLSGGQRQRIAIARALLTDPRILILDDSTSAIDSATEDQIQQAMHRLAKGRTTLLITHRLSQIRTADWVLVLRRGELIDQGTHEDLLARCELYRRIFAHYDPALPVKTLAGTGAGRA